MAMTDPSTWDRGEVVRQFEANEFLCSYASKIRGAQITGEDLEELTDPQNAAGLLAVSSFVAKKVSRAVAALIAGAGESGKDITTEPRSTNEFVAKPSPEQPNEKAQEAVEPTSNTPSAKQPAVGDSGAALPKGKR